MMRPQQLKVDSFELCDVEVETLRRAAVQYGLPFDADKRLYSLDELARYGLVREAYNSKELKEFGVDRHKIITSFDDIVAKSRERLTVDAPFASEVRKWQIPIDLSEMRMLFSEFPAGSVVEPHVHPANCDDDPGGSFRMILVGSVIYRNKRFGPGDWFYIPNGVPYAFTTDEVEQTKLMYCYAFFAPAAGNRFSYPIDLQTSKSSSKSVA